MANGEPLVSIIMPSYNSVKYISETIESVLRQTYEAWELYIIDDCSQDETVKVVNEYIKKCKKIKVLKLEKNSGVAVARTKGISLAVGKYVAFIDSDDIWNKDKLKKQVSFMENNNLMFSCTGYEQIDEKGNLNGVKFLPFEKIGYKKLLIVGNSIGNLTVMYNQEYLGKYKVPLIKKRNDFALWLQLLKDVDYCYGMQSYLAKYRVRSGSISSNKYSLIKYHWDLYTKIEKIKPIRALLYIFSLFIVKTYYIFKRKKQKERCK